MDKTISTMTKFELDLGETRYGVEEINYNDLDLYKSLINGEVIEISKSIELCQDMKSCVVYRLEGHVCQNI